MSSDNFFNQSIPGQQEKVGQLKARRTTSQRAAPPPPPRPSAAAGTGASTYYGKTSTTTASTTRPAAPPPPRPRVAAAGTSTTKHKMTAATISTNHTSTTTPSFYGNTGGYSSSTTTTSTASSATGSSYYSTPAPALVATNETPAADAQTSDGWYSAPAPAAQASNANDDWYSATPQQHSQFQSQQQQQVQPHAYTDFSQPKQQHQSSTELAGAMDGGSVSATPFYTGSTFTPSAHPATMQSSSNIMEDFENEPPLLEELGINMQHILIKTKAVVLPLKRFGVDAQAVMHDDDNDLAGPLVFALTLGGELLLSGKFQFSYIYGFGLFGCLSMTGVLNLMSPSDAVSIWTVASILGYALLPVNVLAIVKILVVNLGKFEKVGGVLAVLTIAWCTIASTRLLEQKCGMRDQRYLVAYPIALLYSAFVMITIF